MKLVAIVAMLCAVAVNANGDAWRGNDRVDPNRAVWPQDTGLANGCGPGWTRPVDEANDGTRFADEHVFRDARDLVFNDDARFYYVNFRAACDLHDVGYAGCGPQNPGACRYFIYDQINQQVIDYSTWSRKDVDDKLLADAQRLCDLYITPERGYLDAALTRRVEHVTDRDREAAAYMRRQCRAHGTGLPGIGTWGAATLHQLVREFGASSFTRFSARRAEPVHQRGEYERLP
jgi:hypothetical protein